MNQRICFISPFLDQDDSPIYTYFEYEGQDISYILIKLKLRHQQ